MRILVTGATGFIGGRVAAALSADGHDVIATGRNPERVPRWAGWGGRFVAAELADAARLDDLTRGTDVVVHCAGKAGTWGPRADYLRANVEVTDLLLAASARAGVSRFINLSSPSIYFAFRDQLGLREEDVPARFADAYGESKYLAERRVAQAHGTAMATVSLRPRAVLGAGDDNVVPRVLDLHARGALVKVGRGDHLVSVTSVHNVVHAVQLCLTAPAAAMGQAYNITDADPVQFWAFVAGVLARFGLPFQPRQLPYRPLLWAARVSKLAHTALGSEREPALLPIKVGVASHAMTLDIGKARRQLGYQPVVDTEHALDEFVAWWHRKGAARN